MKIDLKDKPYVEVATLGGLGRVRLMPGTAACLAALPFYLFLQSGALFFIFTVLSMVLAFAVCTRAENALGKKDHKSMVIDDFCGMLITFLFVPYDFRVMLAGFFLFRMLDMLKVFPANLAEKQPGSIGVVGDDVIAGIYANIILRTAIYFAFKL